MTTETTKDIFHIRRGRRPASMRRFGGDIDNQQYSDGTPLHAYDDEVVIPLELAAMVRSRDITLWEFASASGKFNEEARLAVYRELRDATRLVDSGPEAVEMLEARYLEATKPKTVRLTIEVPVATERNLRHDVEVRGGRVVEE